MSVRALPDPDEAERAEDAYFGHLADEALAEVEAGAPTIPWEQLKAELEAGE